jgi:hypothetical protein
MLQSDIQTLVMKKFRPGCKPSKVFRQALALAQDEILYAQLEGHRSPREVEFEW